MFGSFHRPLNMENKGMKCKVIAVVVCVLLYSKLDTSRCALDKPIRSIDFF